MDGVIIFILVYILVHLGDKINYIVMLFIFLMNDRIFDRLQLGNHENIVLDPTLTEPLIQQMYMIY